MSTAKLKLPPYLDNKDCLRPPNSSKCFIAYFEEVLKLHHAGERFPVDLDDVWELIYESKGSAVRCLFDYCIDIEFKRTQEYDSKGGGPYDRYELSLSCFEGIIIRKDPFLLTTYFDIFKNKIKEHKENMINNKLVVQEPKTNTLGKIREINQIKTYFEEVLRLKKSGEDFPVDLDDVWELVYSGKNKAVRSLTKDFLQGIDYQVLTLNGQNPLGGRPIQTYKLSTSCLEYFVARKVRAVFDVYRNVFHQTIEEKEKQHAIPGSFAEALRLAADLEDQITVIKPKADYFDDFIGNREGLHSTSDISKGYGITAKRFNALLHILKVQWTSGNGVWKLYKKYSELEPSLCGYKTDHYGKDSLTTHMYWTEEGKQLIATLLRDKGFIVGKSDHNNEMIDVLLSEIIPKKLPDLPYAPVLEKTVLDTSNVPGMPGCIPVKENSKKVSIFHKITKEDIKTKVISIALLSGSAVQVVYSYLYDTMKTKYGYDILGSRYTNHTGLDVIIENGWANETMETLYEIEVKVKDNEVNA